MTKHNYRRQELSTLDGPSSPGHRHARLEAALLTELNLLLRDEVTDPTLLDVTVRSVTLSADYHHARAHFTLSDDAPPSPEQVRRAQLALDRASGFLRGGLASALDLKRTPALKFLYAPGAQKEDEEDAWWK